MTDKKIPVLKCFRSSKGQVKAWCPYCKNWHIHGVGNNDIRPNELALYQAHCETSDSPFKGGSYYLQLMTQKEIKDVAGSLELHRSKKSSSG